MKPYLCIKNYWDIMDQCWAYRKGQLCLFSEKDLDNMSHLFDEYFVEYAMQVKEAATEGE